MLNVWVCCVFCVCWRFGCVGCVGCIGCVKSEMDCLLRAFFSALSLFCALICWVC